MICCGRVALEAGMAKPELIQITPFMHVPDLEAALTWFAMLGFEVQFREHNYAYVSCGSAAVRVLESFGDDGAPFTPHKGFAYYVDVEDVDAIHKELAPKLAAASVEFNGPVDQPYRQRELMIRAPDGNVFVFGAPIGRGQT
jgi:catechol 2,3-dioxygenase-like lactoylglutathione lyase family enzyme